MAIYTDNPKDPCGYCCGWIDDPEDESGQTQIPINVDGSEITHLYRKGHKRCLAMLAAYEEDHRGDIA